MSSSWFDGAFGVVLRLTQRRLVEDSIAAVDAIRASGLDWTIIRAPRLTDEPGSGELYVGPVGRESGTMVARGHAGAHAARGHRAAHVGGDADGQRSLTRPLGSSAR
jgi:hypothetical protein